MNTQPTALAQLRHLYQNMLNGGVRDAESAKRIAEGLLGPAIEALERGTPATGGEPAGWLYDWFSDEGELVRDWFTTDHDEAHSEANQAHNIRALDYRGTPATGVEPVAWRYQDARGHYRYRGYVPRFDKDYALLKPIPLYTSPQPVREPLSTIDLMRVVMKADEETQDTRGTTNWAAHIGKAVQAAVLSGGAQPVREPLTPEQIKDLRRKHPAEDTCGWSYELGLRDGERAHGITGGKT